MAFQLRRPQPVAMSKHEGSDNGYTFERQLGKISLLHKEKVEDMDHIILQEKLNRLAKLQAEILVEHQVGHPEWYAEVLGAAALRGTIAKTNQRNYDIECASGKIQVKCRVDGTDGKQNRVNVGKYEHGSFDTLMFILFRNNYRIEGAILLPFNECKRLMKKAGHLGWPDAISSTLSCDITDLIRSISHPYS